MLSKKQYLYTLIAAVIVFGVIFLVTYFYTKDNSWQVETTKATIISNEELASAIEEVEECILPQTKIVLKNQNLNNKSISQTKLDARSLLGLNREELGNRFEGYTIETFSEKEVTLVKNVEPTISKEEDITTYVLGVEDQYVCIKEKGTSKRPVKIDYEVIHFSKYIYSLLLNEEIEITSAQKEALLLNPSMLQRVLQGYVGE